MFGCLEFQNPKNPNLRSLKETFLPISSLALRTQALGPCTVGVDQHLLGRDLSQATEPAKQKREPAKEAKGQWMVKPFFTSKEMSVPSHPLGLPPVGTAEAVSSGPEGWSPGREAGLADGCTIVPPQNNPRRGGGQRGALGLGRKEGGRRMGLT